MYNIKNTAEQFKFPPLFLVNKTSIKYWDADCKLIVIGKKNTKLLSAEIPH